MEIEQYLCSQPLERQNILRNIHEIIMEKDAHVQAVVEPMMGKEMIVYKCQGMMKYGLSGVKSYMSLHVMPIYGSASLHSNYMELLPNAVFQKGCINFVNESAMPLDVVRDLMIECARVDLLKLKDQYLRSRKGKG